MVVTHLLSGTDVMLMRLFGLKKKKDTVACQEPLCDFDAEMNYCPQCNEEYRIDILHCVACDIPLVSGVSKRKEFLAALQAQPTLSMEMNASDPVVTIQQGPMKEIKELKMVLAAKSIPAILASEGPARAGCCGGPQLMLQVRVLDQQKALEILAEEFRQKTHLDNHDISSLEHVYDDNLDETHCPGCNCCFSTKEPACPECGLTFVA